MKRLTELYHRLRRSLDVLVNDGVLVQGHVLTSTNGGGTWAYHGKNLITNQFRIHVAGVLARPSAVGVTYDDDTGYDASDLVFPTYIGIGTGTTAATGTDTGPAIPLLKGGLPATYPITRIRFHDALVDYGADPIHVGYYALIPAGETYDVPGGGTTTSVTIREFVLYDANGRALARKVSDASKNTDTDLLVNWQVRT